MKFKIELLPRYQAAFGFVATPFSRAGLGTVEARLENTLYHKFELSGQQPAKSNGSPFRSDKYYVNGNFNFADLRLKNGDFDIQFGDFNYNITNDDASMFVAPPMISVSREKVINVSKPDRGEGEVVENFSKRSYEISLKGLIVDMENHRYPSSQVKRLRQFFDINDVFEVVSGQLFTDLGIHAMYLIDWEDLSGVEGFEDTMSYSFKARSLQPVEFALYGQ